MNLTNTPANFRQIADQSDLKHSADSYVPASRHRLDVDGSSTIPPTATPPIRFSICHPKRLWPLASDHLPLGFKITFVQKKGSPFDVSVASWNVNSVRNNEGWLLPCNHPQSFVRQLGIEEKIPSTYQGLDNSPSTLPLEQRVRILAKQIIVLLNLSRPDILLIQELDSECSALVLAILKKSNTAYTLCRPSSTLDSQQCLLYRTKAFSPCLQPSEPAMIKHQVIQNCCFQHLKSNFIMRFINVHIPGAPNQEVYTQERKSFQTYVINLLKNSRPNDLLIIGGDMNASPQIMKNFLPAELIIVAPGYPTNIDPFNEQNKFPKRGREVKEIDMLAIRHHSELGATLEPLLMPSYVKQTLQVIASAAAQFKIPEAQEDLDLGFS